MSRDRETTRTDIATAAAIALVVVLSCNVENVALPGGFDLRPMDAPWVVLASASIGRLRGSRAIRPREPSAARAMKATGAAFVGVLVVNAIVVAVTSRDDASTTLASAARVLQAATLVPLVAAATGTRRRRRQVLEVLLYALLPLTVLYTLVNADVVGDMVLFGMNPGKAASGPVAVALLIVCIGVSARLLVRAVATLIAIAALTYAVSMTADLVLAACAAVAVWCATTWARRAILVRVAAVVASTAAVLALSVLSLVHLRSDALPVDVAAPLDVPSADPGGPERHDPGPDDRDDPSVDPGDGIDEIDGVDTGDAGRGVTILHRVILMTAGLRVFALDPVTGVGWTRADDPGFIDRPEVATFVESRFPDASPTLYPHVVPSGTHNAVIQVLAELGVIGALPFVGFGVATVAVAARVVGRPGDRWLDLGTLLLVVSGIGFLAFTGLYPAQPETVLPAVASGIALGRARE